MLVSLVMLVIRHRVISSASLTLNTMLLRVCMPQQGPLIHVELGARRRKLERVRVSESVLWRACPTLSPC
jgi:hypothetical protein